VDRYGIKTSGKDGAIKFAATTPCENGRTPKRNIPSKRLGPYESATPFRKEGKI
jgi:hypothetical protein